MTSLHFKFATKTTHTRRITASHTPNSPIKVHVRFRAVAAFRVLLTATSHINIFLLNKAAAISVKVCESVCVFFFII